MQLNKAVIKQFIRDSLGCACPDTVFESIRIEQNPGIIANVKTEYSMVIGDKLLVYVIEPDNWTLLTGNLKQIFDWGRARRDAAGLNRFRLVLATTDIQRAQDALFQYLDTMTEFDKRLHLHVISPENLPRLIA